MDPYLLLTIVTASICFFIIVRKFRFYQENKEIDSSSLTTSSSVAPSLSSHNWTHDVFPSFRGEDVRSNFLSHIQKEFQRKGITPFIDNEIKRGEFIGPELIRAIKGSKIAIILLSRNYASSKWCLEELVEIMNCRKDLGQTVMAIFYKVDPSDVKKLTGDFGKVFKKTCAGRSKEDIKRWRQALAEVATIAGYHLSNKENEAATIERIATDVSNELISSAPSNDFNSLIGMRTHIENMEPFIRLESDEARMIGIWGPSGIGKSTIARFLFSRYANQFQLCVFMENIKRRYPRPYYDEYNAKLQLHKEFLSQIINQEDIKINHLGVIQERLKNQRAFVVLDDVDHLLQLDATAEKTWWFGPGSRIIITTQDKKILKQHGINHIYEVGFPRIDEALQIFCMYAFGQNTPYEGFKDLAWEATRLSGNLPLGLRVMGSHFKGMDKDEWKKELPRLRSSLDGEIESILKFSYDALLEEDKGLFLYIACFFNGEPIEKVEAHLADDFVDVRQGLHVLAEKSLISLEEGYIKMHDLLTRLGRVIVRKQSIQDPEKRQFLLDPRDICKVLSNDTTVCRSVIGIDIKIYEFKEELYISEKVFERMYSLQFLRIRHSEEQSRQFPYLPGKVKLLEWPNFPMKSFPSSFNPEFLVELIMPKSKLERLWEGIQPIQNLKWMILQYSKDLKELPNLSTATNLKELNLKGCSSLVELPFSIGNATNLEKLDLSQCSSLVELPSSIGNIINLEKLNLDICSRLVELPSSIGNAINLKELNLWGCSSLAELPSSIGNIINLEKLFLWGCSSLVELPSSIWNGINLKDLNLTTCSSLVELPFSIGNATNLEKLDLAGCSSLVELPSSIGNAINLEYLNLEGCSSLVELPSSIGNVINLKNLDLMGCSSLVELPSSIGNAINLKKLDLTGCSSLVELPSSIGNAINIKTMNLNNCSSLVELPSSIGNLINLKEWNLSRCTSLVELPSSIENASNLENLNLWCCSSLVELPSSIGNIINLKELDLRCCSSLMELPSSIGNATNLKELNLWDCSSLVELPLSIGNVINLKKLNLWDCSSLVELPISIGNAINLMTLYLGGCTKLVSLPKLPESLTFLDAENCESLETLDCSFHNTEFGGSFNFAKCFKLNQEARDLIMTSTCKNAVLPGEKVPTNFTYRAIGSSLSVTLNGIDMHLPRSLRFKACFLLIYKGDGEVCDTKISYLPDCIREKRNGINVMRISSFVTEYLNEHLYIFDVEETVNSSELIFKFEVDDEDWEIRECGISTPTLQADGS